MNRTSRRHACQPFRDAWLVNDQMGEGHDELAGHIIAIARVLDAIGEPVPAHWQVRIGMRSIAISEWHPYGEPCPRASEGYPTDCQCEHPESEYIPMVEAPELLTYAGNVLTRFYPRVKRACIAAGIEV